MNCLKKHRDRQQVFCFTLGIIALCAAAILLVCAITRHHQAPERINIMGEVRYRARMMAKE